MNSSEHIIKVPLHLIQRRLRLRRCGAGMSAGFCTIPFAVFFFVAAGTHNLLYYPAVFLSTGFLCVLAGAVIGWLLSPCGAGLLLSAARLADKHYKLEDRLLTAVSILQKKRNLTAIEQLQIEDAAMFAKDIRPRDIVLPPVQPFNQTGALIYVVLYAVLMLYFLNILVPFSSIKSKTISPPVSAEIKPSAEPLSPEVESLLVKMRRYSKQYNQTADSKQQTAENKENKLSGSGDVSEAMKKKLRYWDTAAKIASMNDIADAFDAAAATKKAAGALKDKRYSDAAHELNQMNSDLISTMSNKERKEVADMLQKAIQKTKDRGQTPLAETIEKIETSLKMGQAEGFDELAQESKQLAMQQMQQQMEEAKEGQTLSYAEGSGSGGKDTDKSKQEGKNFGTGEAGNPTGSEATQLDSKKERQELSGIIGEGESEFEKSKDPLKKTEREYQDLQYVIKKAPEDVLNKEPLPLEQRQTLKRYFDTLNQSGNVQTRR